LSLKVARTSAAMLALTDDLADISKNTMPPVLAMQQRGSTTHSKMTTLLMLLLYQSKTISRFGDNSVSTVRHDSIQLLDAADPMHTA